MGRLTVVAAILLSFTVVGDASAETKPLSAVPFELVDSRILVNVKINGTGAFHCILDTGANFAITPETAKRLGLQGKSQ